MNKKLGFDTARHSPVTSVDKSYIGYHIYVYHIPMYAVWYKKYPNDLWSFKI